MAEAPAGIVWREQHPVIGESCTGCLECTLYCPEGALAQQRDKVAVTQELCNGCGTCAMECPAGAVAMEREYTGAPGIFPVGEGKA